jgi:hypothetical protein
MDTAGVAESQCRAALKRKRETVIEPALSAGFFAAAISLASGAAAQMMMLPGQFDVGPTGAALYSVPIEVPPGTGGMSPALTLDYDSDGGNGLLGVGWNLGGLPSIGRCPKTMATDGVRGRIDFSLSDRFCMDGQRLVLIAGTYGGAGSEYRTEIEGFTKIMAYGAAGNGPNYFRAWTKSGQIIEFGNTADSRILATGTTTARSWAANKISDTKGNYLTVSYTNDASSGEAYPTRIDYTGNAGSSPVLTPYNSVRFEYEARPDIVPLHIAGSMVKNTVRLKRIKTYQGATTVVRIYELAYGTGSSTQRSKITSIKLCDGTGTTCLPATSFSMTNPSLTFPTEVGSPVGVGSSYILYFGDWNGDGVTDVMNWNRSNGANNWYINDGALGLTTYANRLPTAQVAGSSSQLFLGDWDGDAITDVMWWNPGTGANNWFINSSAGGAPTFTQTTNPIATTALSSSSSSLALGDWDGDARTDLLWYNSSGANRFFKLTSSSPLTFTQHNSLITLPGNMSSHVLVTGEFNGDSFSDVLIDNPTLTSGGFWAFVGDGDMSFTQRPFASDVAGGSIGLGDWNGDGVTDVMTHRFTSGSNRFWLNDGTGQFIFHAGDIITPSTIVNFVPYVGDWNADGLSDLMFHQPSSGSNRWFTTSWSSAGAMQFAYVSNPIWAINISGSGGAMAFGDWNGRAFEAPMWWLASNGSNRWYRNDAATPPDRLTSVTTGLGATTMFTLKPITDNSVYTKETTATYPVIDIEAPFYVVSRVDADNGVGGDYSSTYRYVGAKIDLHGRGFLGFRQQVSTDLQTSVAQTLTFRQDFPYVGFVREDKKVRSGVILNERDNVYNATTSGTAPNIRRWPYLQSATEAATDLSGAPFPTVTTSYTYDGYGNPLTIAVSTPDGAVRTTVNTYSNDATGSILGRLLSSSVSSTTPDVTPAPTGCQSNCSSTTPFFSVNNVTAAEGSAAAFTVTRTGSATGSYSVNYATANGTAIAGSDYAAKSGTLTFATGDATKTVSVTTLSDAVSESSETFTLNLSSPTGGATITDGQGTGTITNVGPAPSFSISNATAAEGSSALFTVTRSGASTGSYSLNYATADGTATAGTDYTTASGALTFASGETSKTISVATLADAASEGNETFMVNLSSPTGGATITDSQGVGTITNVAPAASFSVSNASADEGAPLDFTVTRSGDASASHSINYATANDEATSPSDFAGVSGTLTFAAGQTTKTVSVQTFFGSDSEPAVESMYLNLSSPSAGATISDGQGQGDIFNVPQEPMCGDVLC